MPDDKTKKPDDKPVNQPRKRSGEGLDRSNEGAVAVGRARRKPAPIGAPADRYTTDSRRKG